MKNVKKILAIGAHPDDIEFGCGGTLLLLASRKYEIHLLILSTGEVGERGIERKSEQMESAEILSAKVHWGGFSDTRIPVDRTSIEVIEKIVDEVSPDLIFSHYGDDTHQDHRAVAQATLSATRYIRNVLFYEVPTTQNFNPTVYVDIESVFDGKENLLRAHSSQVLATRIANLSILETAQSTAYFRGYQGRVKYAEGFCPARFSLFWPTE